jgi:transposase
VRCRAVIAAVGDGRRFRSGRDFAAWVGLTPREHSSGGKSWKGGISKKGNPQLRRLLVTGATSQTRGERWKHAPGGTWFGDLLKRKPHRAATVALANKRARIAWAVLTRGEDLRSTVAPGAGNGSCPASAGLQESGATSE